VTLRRFSGSDVSDKRPVLSGIKGLSISKTGSQKTVFECNYIPSPRHVYLLVQKPPSLFTYVQMKSKDI
jgi:hypothetical protein